MEWSENILRDGYNDYAGAFMMMTSCHGIKLIRAKDDIIESTRDGKEKGNAQIQSTRCSIYSGCITQYLFCISKRKQNNEFHIANIDHRYKMDGKGCLRTIPGNGFGEA